MLAPEFDLLYTEYGDISDLRNVGNYLPIDTAKSPRRYESSS